MTKEIKKVLVVGLITLGILAILFFIFTKYVDDVTGTMNSDRLLEIAHNNAASMRKIFKNDMEVLNSISAFLESNEAEGIAKELIETAGKNKRYTRLIFISFTEGGYSSDGFSIESIKLPYYDKIMAGDAVITEVSPSVVDNKLSFSVAVPVRDEQKQVIGVLAAEYRANYLRGAVDLHSFSGEGYFHLVDNSGKFLIQTGQGDTSSDKDNVLEVLRASSFSGENPGEKMGTDMKNGASSFVTYTLGGIQRYAYYSPININDWYLLSVVPMDYLTRQSYLIDRAVVILMLGVSLLFILIASVLIWLNRNIRKAIIKDRDFFENLIQTLPIPIFLADGEKRLEYLNQAALALWGKKSVKEMQGVLCSTMQASNCNSENCAIERMYKDNESCTYTEKDGVHYRVTTAVWQRQKQAFGFIEVLQDVTELVRTKQSLEEKTLELEAISEHMNGAMIVTYLDEGLTIVRCNTGYLTMTGLTLPRILGTKAMERIPKAERARIQKSIQTQLKNEGEVSLEHAIHHENGGKTWVIMRGKRMQLRGKWVGVWLLTDISAIKEAEQELRISEERYRIATQSGNDIVLEYDIPKKTMYHNQKAAKIFGIPEIVENIPGTLFESGVILPAYRDVVYQMFEEIHRGEKKAVCEVEHRDAKGENGWTKITFITIFDENEKPNHAIGLLEDITKEKNAIARYEREVLYHSFAAEEALLHYEIDLTRGVFIKGHEEVVKGFGKEGLCEYAAVTALLVQALVAPEDRAHMTEELQINSLMDYVKKGNNKKKLVYNRVMPTGEMMATECLMYFFEDEKTGNKQGIVYIREL